MRRISLNFALAWLVAMGLLTEGIYTSGSFTSGFFPSGSFPSSSFSPGLVLPAGAYELMSQWEIDHPSEAARSLIGKQKFSMALLVTQANLAKRKGPEQKEKVFSGNWRLDATGHDLVVRLLTAKQLERIHYADMYNLEGIAYQGLKQRAKAEASFRQAIALNPRHCLAYSNLAGVLIGQGEYDEAMLAANQAIQINRRFHSAYYNRASIYRARSQFDLESKDLETWRHWQKRNGIDGLNLSNISSVEFMLCMLSKNPGTAKNYVALGVVNKELFKLAASQASFMSAIKLEPKLLEARWAHALLLMTEKHYQRAVKELNQAIAIDPTFAIPYFNRARAYCEMHQYDLAIADCSKFIALSSPLISSQLASSPLANSQLANSQLANLVVEAYGCRASCYGKLKQFDASAKDTDMAHKLKLKLRVETKS